MGASKFKFLAMVGVLLLYSFGLAQEATPSLTDVQKQQLQILAQRIEIAQLKAQIAQRDFDVARSEITALVTSLQVKGFTLDLTTFAYTAEQKKDVK